MALIEWSEKFSVGNKQIDEQHQKWIGIYNTAHEKMMSTDINLFRSVGEDALQEMKSYGEYHFSFEEKFMESIGYEGLDFHKQLHKGFMEKIDKIIRDINSGTHILNSEIIKTIENWLLHHILIEDQKIKPFIKTA